MACINCMLPGQTSSPLPIRPVAILQHFPATSKGIELVWTCTEGMTGRGHCVPAQCTTPVYPRIAINVQACQICLDIWACSGAKLTTPSCMTPAREYEPQNTPEAVGPFWALLVSVGGSTCTQHNAFEI